MQRNDKGTLIVTGGSRGIGAEISRLAGSRGWSVCVNYTAAKDAAKAVVEDIEASGGRAIHVRGDVSNENEIQELFQQSAEQLGPITGLVNNAGIMDSRGRFDELDRERTRRMLDVNVLGPFLCCKTAIRYMANRHGGRAAQLSIYHPHHQNTVVWDLTSTLPPRSQPWIF